MSEHGVAAGAPNKKLDELNEWVEIQAYEGDPHTLPEYWGIPTRVQMRLQKGGIALDLYVPGYGSYQFIEVPALDESPLIEQRAVLNALEELRGEMNDYKKYRMQFTAPHPLIEGVQKCIDLIDARIAALKETTT